MSGYRGRLAPSPTGLLHLGHARTFWTAYERARRNQSAGGGILVLRDEDLDTQRARADFAAAMLEDLRWLGIDWQEGPDVGGAFGPYRQSERYGLYRAAWEGLRADGWIYPCTCSRRELAAAVSAPHEDEHGGGVQDDDDEPVYPGRCRPATGVVAEADQPAGVNWRFRIPDGRLADGRVPEGETIAFEDSGAGARSYVAGRDFGDFVVWRRDDVPAYQLACVVDDAAMRITEVVRGADLLKSTARQILLYRALGLTPPLWHHCALLRDENGQRLAKRTDALSLRALRERGLSPVEVRAIAPAEMTILRDDGA
ncbi:MAG TPA: tRNA glutamyl-Q(34) synthetase GluQRS [Acidobacteriaceae bacterium]|jgi:glutamyl-tRNA synthetase